jgi:hypothetical protein
MEASATYDALGSPSLSGWGSAGYELGDRLGDTGEVYEGHHPRFSDPFVIKRFPRALGATAAAVQAFSREAGRVSLLGYPNIARVLDSGLLRDGTPFLAVERLYGWTLEERLARRGPLLLSELLPVLRGITSALAAAHAAGVVHRELRPDNVFLVDRDHEPGSVKVLDFGVSRLTFATASADGDFNVEDDAYLAPEQAQGQHEGVDARADQFALAAITYRMLSDADSFPLYLVPASFGGRPSACDAVLRRALSKRPDDRFGSVAQFFRAFEEAFVRSLASARASVVTLKPKLEELESAALADPDPTLVTRPRAPSWRAPLVQLVVMAMTMTIVVTAFGDRGWGWQLLGTWRHSRLWPAMTRGAPSGASSALPSRASNSAWTTPVAVAAPTRASIVPALPLLEPAAFENDGAIQDPATGHPAPARAEWIRARHRGPESSSHQRRRASPSVDPAPSGEAQPGPPESTSELADPPIDEPNPL